MRQLDGQLDTLGKPVPPSTVLPVDSTIVEACRPCSNRMGGKTLTNVGVTSALVGEGRTTIAMALARIQSEDLGRTVVLVEMDFERPSMARKLGLPAGPGVSDYALGAADTQDIVYAVSERVFVVTAGTRNLLGPRVISELGRRPLVERLLANVDVVIADLPPILGCSYGPATLAGFEDLLLVVRAGSTSTGSLREIAGDLPSNAWALLNGARSSLPKWLLRLSAG